MILGITQLFSKQRPENWGIAHNPSVNRKGQKQHDVGVLCSLYMDTNAQTIIDIFFNILRFIGYEGDNAICGQFTGTYFHGRGETFMGKNKNWKIALTIKQLNVLRHVLCIFLHGALLLFGWLQASMSVPFK